MTSAKTSGKTMLGPTTSCSMTIAAKTAALISGWRRLEISGGSSAQDQSDAVRSSWLTSSPGYPEDTVRPSPRTTNIAHRSRAMSPGYRCRAIRLHQRVTTFMPQG